ncbi:MAG: SUMF1/EgtB/PvdO family nonheme iron enzyme [Planctomycetes bacterium]|nr:SUMF1/EgtB/PvdO family nonheme iron enzyme [Planctomycetota bacterium]
MHISSLRVPMLATVSATTFLLGAAAQNAAASKPGPASNGAAKTDKPADDVAGLPPFLLMVPGGTVRMGLDAERFIAAASQVVNQAQPDKAASIAPAKLTEVMRRSASTLGPREVKVESFLLGKWNVKCSEYDLHVSAMRKAGVKQRAPFLQWSVGRKDDLEKRLEDIGKQYPKDPLGPVYYWEQNGGELPYAMLDSDGKPTEDHPVTGITFYDANEFAGRYGFRLPVEAEWMRAARGDGSNVWPGSDPKNPASDRYTEDLLKLLGMHGARDKKLKPTGKVATAAGPFGHQDMFGQVWQFMGDLGYGPINGPDPFAAEWQKIQKNKTIAPLLTSPPSWKDDKAIAKGGSYLSGGEPIQLLIDGRAPMQTVEVLESLGFRLAKSLKPGYDAVFSALRGSFSRVRFGIDQDVDLQNQVGAERYEIGPTGFPSDYQTVSFAPMNWLTKEKGLDLPKLLDKSQRTPMPIGVLMTTTKLVDAAVVPGLYLVMWREGGVPKELAEAVKAGQKALDAAAKRGDGDKPEEDKRKNAWKEVVQAYGLTDKDLTDAAFADGKVPFVRVDELAIPTDQDYLVLAGSDGKPSAVLPASAKPAGGAPIVPSIAFEADKNGKAIAKFKVCVPVQLGAPKKTANFDLRITLDREVPSAAAPWRMPAAR